MILAWLCLLYSGLVDHDLRMARFNISESENGYTLDINFDRADFLKTIYATDQYQSDVLEQAKIYIRQNLQYVFDGDSVSFELDSIQYTEENIFLTGMLMTARRNISEIQVANTCLIEDVEGHLNIMEFFLNGKKRFFRLDENRITTTIKYTQ